MDVRPAIETDIPAIVDLLKISLGESLMPKSEGYWRWKHVMNPFGQSPVLLAVDSDRIVGVRAFMRWQWVLGGNVYPAVRAVDTATHPEFQGKGIFKKLTLSLAKACEAQGDRFVFNTPNEKSKVGYLKMGWQPAGKLPVRVGIRRPFSITRNMITGVRDADETSGTDQMLRYFLNHPGLERIVLNATGGDRLVTKVTPEYLRWRYLDVPVVKYEAVGSESANGLDGLILGRVKVSKFGREFRITDVFPGSRVDDRKLAKMFNEKMEQHKIDFVTLSGTRLPLHAKIHLLPNLSLPIGPVVTVRPLMLKNLDVLAGFHRWSPSLGDLELF